MSDVTPVRIEARVSESDEDYVTAIDGVHPDDAPALIAQWASQYGYAAVASDDEPDTVPESDETPITDPDEF